MSMIFYVFRYTSFFVVYITGGRGIEAAEGVTDHSLPSDEKITPKIDYIFVSGYFLVHLIGYGATTQNKRKKRTSTSK